MSNIRHHTTKLALTGLAFFLAAACASTPVRAEAIAGFDRLSWGMSREQVASAYPNFEDWDKDELDALNGPDNIKWIKKHKYGLRSYTVMGCDMELSLEFLDNKLELVYVTSNDPHIDHCRESIKSSLMEKYGSNFRQVLPDNKTSVGLEWHLKDAITVNYHENRGADKQIWSYGITYLNKEALDSWLRSAGSNHRL